MSNPLNPVEDGAAPLEVSLSELAAMKGVTAQAISKRLKRLEAEGLITSHRRGRDRMVVLARWDQVTGETTDLSRAIGRSPAMPGAPDGVAPTGDQARRDPTYTTELTRKARYDADLKELELEKQRGSLLAVRDVEDAMATAAGILVREIHLLTAHAEELAAAVGKNGSTGAREVLKRLEHQYRATVARALAAALSNEVDPDEADD